MGKLVDFADISARIDRMTDFRTLCADDAPAPAHRPGRGAQSDGRPPTPTGAPDGTAQSRFGAAASLLDRLDTLNLCIKGTLVDGLRWERLQRSINARRRLHFLDHVGHGAQSSESKADSDNGAHNA